MTFCLYQLYIQLPGISVTILCLLEMPLGDDDCSFAGVEVKFKGMVYPVLIQPNHIPELTSVSPNSSGLRVGAAVTLNDLEQALRNEIELQPGKNMFRLIFRKYDEVDFNIN